MAKEQRLRWNGNIEAQRQADEAYQKLLDSQGREERLAKARAKLERAEKKRREALQRASRPDYYKYIKSKRWKAKREAAIDFYGGVCSICGSTRNLQVHHKTYHRLGNEKMKDLKVLCAGCHANSHEGEVLGICDPVTREFLAIF